MVIYKIKKKNGKYRTIYEPNSLLKHIQRQILVKILDNKAISKYAKAYHKGINLKDNAIPHLNKELILKLDIKDFFENISFIDVYNSCFSIEYFPKSVGMILTYLCTYDDYLMQGAPTSAYISNLVMKEFDEVLGLWCEENNISYTRYSDDMTFSGEFNPREVIVKVRKMLYKLGLELNNKKIHIIHKSSNQNVTGIVVNEKVQVSAKYRKEIRQEIYYCKKYGIENHMKHSVLKKKSRQLSDSLKGQINFDVDVEISKEQYINSLMGRINYVLSVEDNEEMREYKEWLYGCGNTQKF